MTTRLGLAFAGMTVLTSSAIGASADIGPRQAAPVQPTPWPQQLRERYVIVPSSESRARAGRLLPLKGSEDARYLLVRPAAPPRATSGRADKPRDVVPDEDAQWVVDIALPDGSIVTGEQVQKAYGPEWQRQIGGATLYGYSPDEKRWTLVVAKNAPRRWTRLAIAKDLLATYVDSPQPENEGSLARFLEAIRERASQLQAVRVNARREAAAAAARASKYFECWKAADHEAVLVLRAAAGAAFDGRRIWDVMYSLGLEWGDGDFFHWRDSDQGGRSLFSVSTTTAPGYFLPEQIADGSVHAQDLVFSFSVPRSLTPDATLTEMLKAARYAQKRLGGVLLNVDGQPFDEKSERDAIARAIARLRQDGFQPGTGLALRIF